MDTNIVNLIKVTVDNLFQFCVPNIFTAEEKEADLSYSFFCM